MKSARRAGCDGTKVSVYRTRNNDRIVATATIEKVVCIELVLIGDCQRVVNRALHDVVGASCCVIVCHYSLQNFDTRSLSAADTDTDVTVSRTVV